MFDYIKIEGFRSFKKVELEMPRLAVLIGPNGGGKSNLLDLMSLMSEAGRGELEEAIASRGGFASIAFGFDWFRDILVEFRFRARSGMQGLGGFEEFSEEPALDARFALQLKSEGPTPVVSVEEVSEEQDSQSGSTVPVMTRRKRQCVFRSINKGAGEKTEEGKTLDSDSELAIFQVKDLHKYPTPYRILKQFQQWRVYRDISVGPEAPIRLPRLVRRAVRLLPDGANLGSVLHSIQQRYPDAWEEITEILHTACADFRTVSFPAEGGDGKVGLLWREQPFEKEGVSANLLSDGTLKLLCMVAILKTPNPPPLVCIDEPELGLHPDWIKLVAELLQDAAARTQVIVATHSPQLVGKLEPDEIIVTEKENGETQMERLSTQDLEKWLRDFNLADLWLSGHLGGRP